MRRVGSRGQHNPPFLPSQWALQRGVGKGGVLGAWQRGSETQPSEGTSSNPLPRTFSSALEPFPPPAASQQSQSVILTLAAASVGPNLNGGGSSGEGALLHLLACLPASFSIQELLWAWLRTY